MYLSAHKIIDYCNAILSNSEFNAEDIIETDTGDAMLPPEETGYIVVECKRAINENNNRVCVIPKTWIICEIIPDKKVAFVYPTGNDDSIAIRVKNKERPDSSWKTYLGVIISESESYEDAVGYLQTFCEGNSEQIEDNSHQQSHENAVNLDTICGENSEQIEDTSNQIELITDPKNPLKLHIVRRVKPEKKKNSEKKYHKKHSKDKVHKSKDSFMEQLSFTDNITESSSLNSVDTRVGTESYMSCQSNCQSSESSPKSLESEISSSVHSAPETHLKNNNNNSSSLKRILLQSLDAEKEHHDGMLSEDRQLVENMYLNIIRHVQYMKKMALEMKKSHLIVIEHKKILNKIAAKYKIPLPPVIDPVERENERNGDLLEEVSVQNDEIETLGDDVMKNEQNENQFDEENLQDNEIGTQGDDITENEAPVTEEIDNTTQENQLVERKNAETLMESNSDNQTSDDESTKVFFSSPLEDVKYKRKNINKDNDIHTLKHPRPGKGLIQMGRNSRFYITAIGLERAKRTSRDVKQFARELFKEVFTHKALGTCSMTGNNEPALHYEARTILQSFALKYGQDVGWDSIEPKELQKNLIRLLWNTKRYYYNDGKKTRRWKPHRAKRALSIGLHLKRPAHP